MRGNERRHFRFGDLPALLMPGDLLVFNDSGVMTGAAVRDSSRPAEKIEMLLTRPLGGGRSLAMVKGAVSLKEDMLFAGRR